MRNKKDRPPRKKTHRGKKTWDKRVHGQGPKSNANFKVQCSDIEGYIFYLWLIALENFARMMKDL